MKDTSLLMIVLAFILGCMCSGMMKQICGGQLVEGLYDPCVPNSSAADVTNEQCNNHKTEDTCKLDNKCTWDLDYGYADQCYHNYHCNNDVEKDNVCTTHPIYPNECERGIGGCWFNCHEPV